jgi:hypothetical protein
LTRCEFSYNFNEIFSVRSNVPYFDALLHSFRNNDDGRRAGISLGFFLDKDLKISVGGKSRVNLMLYFDPLSGNVEFNYPWLRTISARLVNSNPSQFSFSFNKNYLRFSNVVAEGWELIDVLRSLLLMSLIQSGMYMIHGGAVKVGGQGILIPSFGNTGKTTTTWMLARRGAKFLTDEFAILGRDGLCYGFPCSSLVSSALAKEADLGLSRRERAGLFFNDLSSKLLSTRFHAGGIKLCPDDHFETSDKVKIDKIVFIENGQDAIWEIDRNRATSMMGAIQSYELNWRANPYIIAHSYFGLKPDLDEISHLEKEVVRTQMSKISKFYVVSSRPGRHHEAIWKLAE